MSSVFWRAGPLLNGAHGAKRWLWLYNFIMLVADEGAWIGHCLLVGRKMQGWALGDNQGTGSCTQANFESAALPICNR